LSALLLIDKHWFLTEGKDLLLCSSYFPLGVSQLPGHNNHQLHARHHLVARKEVGRRWWRRQRPLPCRLPAADDRRAARTRRL
jgi:hypothetical protein